MIFRNPMFTNFLQSVGISKEDVAKELSHDIELINHHYLMDEYPKHIAEKILFRFRLTKDDYRWYSLIIEEVLADRRARLDKIEQLKGGIIHEESKKPKPSFKKVRRNGKELESNKTRGENRSERQCKNRKAKTS